MSSNDDTTTPARVGSSDKLAFRDPLMAAGFTQVSNLVLEDPGFSMGAKLTYTLILKFAWQDGYSFPSKATLAAALGVSTRSVYTYVRELIDARLITRFRRSNDSNFYVIEPLANRYELQPVSTSEKPIGSRLPIHMEAGFPLQRPIDKYPPPRRGWVANDCKSNPKSNPKPGGYGGGRGGAGGAY